MSHLLEKPNIAMSINTTNGQITTTTPTNAAVNATANSNLNSNSTITNTTTAIKHNNETALVATEQQLQHHQQHSNDIKNPEAIGKDILNHYHLA